jgi:methylated-DNA-[protein]-cysteine S-methyltransferase
MAPYRPLNPALPDSGTDAFDLFTIPTARALAVARGGRLVQLHQLRADYTEVPRLLHPSARHDPEAPPLPELRRQLAEYFAGSRRQFDLPLDAIGTDFERRVWEALVEIPYGETRTYGGIAAAIGRPQACRAVGRANGLNPIPIIIPCHRVIGSDGSLTGYGGGLHIKRFLLRLEGIELDAAGEARQQMSLPLR